MPIPKRMYDLYCGAYSREAKAIALAESQADPLAISPEGLGAGIMQQSAAWQKDYAPLMGVVGSRLYEWAIAGGPWHPAFQLACYATFVWKHKTLDRLARLRLFHYGHEQDADPDGYAERVMQFFVTLEGW
jgi:hypothetical protein